MHEDHAMMAAFNVTDLPNFNYPQQVSKFIDPVDPRFTARPYDGAVNTLANVTAVTLPFFAALNGYEFHEEVEEALVTFYQTATSTISDAAPTQSEFNGKMRREAVPTGLPHRKRFGGVGL